MQDIHNYINENDKDWTEDCCNVANVIRVKQGEEVKGIVEIISYLHEPFLY